MIEKKEKKKHEETSVFENVLFKIICSFYPFFLPRLRTPARTYTQVLLFLILNFDNKNYIIQNVT